MPAIIILLLFVIFATDELRELDQLIEGHFKSDKTEALLHVSDELGGKLLAETNLGEDVLNVCLYRDKFIDHCYLFCV